MKLLIFVKKISSREKTEKLGHVFKLTRGKCSEYDSASLDFSFKAMLMQPLAPLQNFIGKYLGDVVALSRP